MIPREYMDKMAALQEEIRQLRALAFGTALVFPAEWRLSRTETLLLQCLATRPVLTWDAWSAAATGLKPNFDGGPAVFKVHISHLRKKLQPRGISIILRHGVGYCLEPAVRESLRRFGAPVAELAA